MTIKRGGRKRRINLGGDGAKKQILLSHCVWRQGSMERRK